MFKSKSYNVEKAIKKNEASSSSSSSSSSGMTLKTKDKIKSANNKESPEYRRKALPKKAQVQNGQKIRRLRIKPIISQSNGHLM